ncbi:putative ABC transporter ATP-binding [Dissostichus eleginoides]|uniref:ABC transporter ATP-binding n=1 Tax=Dissostichus eleginoides TaxID=100907 RepID=A0AAD9CI42_DISEL|nr:putative ABC transporter ATP-binding [Dissostichus eleginoides]
MKQGFNFLLLEINITLLEQMGGGRMGSMKKKQDNGIGSGAECPEVIKLHNFHTVANSYFDKLGSNVI